MELSRKSLKRHCLKCTIVYLLTCCMFFNTSLSVVLAGPEGAQVVNGQVAFQQSGYNTTITAVSYTHLTLPTSDLV